MSMNQIANFSGLPLKNPTQKSTRRGGRAGRGIKVHTDAANAAHAAGDHTAARSHLFKAIGALRNQSFAAPSVAPASQTTLEPDDDDMMGAPPSAPMAPAAPKPSGSATLAGMLRNRKK